MFVFLPIPAKTSESSQLLKVAQKRFKDAKESMIARFSGDGTSEATLIVWDHGGQEVQAALREWERPFPFTQQLARMPCALQPN